MRRVRPYAGPFDSDQEHAAPTPARRFLSAMPPVRFPESYGALAKHVCQVAMTLFANVA
jgi:hypothetical protein